MIPVLGAAPERPPRGGHCCAGERRAEEMVGVRRLTNEGTADDLTKVAQMSQAMKTRYSQRRKRRGDLHASVLGMSRVSGVSCGRIEKSYVGVPIPQ